MKQSKTGNPLLDLALLSKSNSDYITSTEQTHYHHDVFLDGDIEEPSQYRDLVSLLFNAGEQDSINIFINSDGGHLDTALAIVEGVKVTQASVTAVINGACHSAASIISMFCHDVIVMDSAYSMIHTASFGSSGSAGNVKAHTEFTVKQVDKLLNEAYEGFLSPEELASVKTGVELWFSAADIRSRMKKRAAHLATKTTPKPNAKKRGASDE